MHSCTEAKLHESMVRKVFFAASIECDLCRRGSKSRSKASCHGGSSCMHACTHRVIGDFEVAD